MNMSAPGYDNSAGRTPPPGFSGILGQETAKKFLKQVMANRKVPHAYLFTGIPGIGKTSTAMAFAMALNCREPVEFDACGKCISCRQFGRNNFPDFLSVVPKGRNIGIDRIKEINRELGFAPVSGGYRVCVIHQAETMTPESANAFLKTLEEPPDGNILILKTTESADLLPTIVSRCQKVPFQPLPASEIETWLIRNRGIGPDVARLLSRICSGSPGRAIRMYESGFLEKRKAWLERLIRLPGLSKLEALDTALACAEEDRKNGIDQVVSGQPGMLDMLAVWANWYRDLLLLKAGGTKDRLVNIDFFDHLTEISAGYNIDSIIAGITALNQAQPDIRRSRNVNLVMIHTVLGLNRASKTSGHTEDE